MSKKRLNKLFSIENIQSTVGTDGEQGTGLGLQIVKEYIGNHGGKIWAESKLGVGSTFKLLFPIGTKI